MPFGGPPDPPNYTAAAQAQSKSSTDAINAQTAANRPNMNTPWGSMSWTNAGGQWTGNMSLSPEQQSALDAQQKVQHGESDLALGMQGQVRDAMSTPMDWGSLPQMPNAETARGDAINATMDRYKSRLDPQWEQRQQQERSQLLGAGLTEDSEAYQREMSNFSRGRNDAYQQAQDSAEQSGAAAADQTFRMGMGAHQQGLSDMLAKRAQPLNEMEALLHGYQVGMPQMPGFAQAGAGQPTQYLNAANMQNSANMGQWGANQQMWGDIFGAAGNAGSKAIPFMF